MIVDENLNDCSSIIIKRLKTASVCWFVSWVLAIIAWLFAFIPLVHRTEEIKELRDKIYKEEQMLSLEYSIGYWFINTPEEINDSVLYQFLLDNNAWYPDILLKQAKIESGNYKSNVYVNSCNLYGMRKVGKRNTTQRGTYNGYGVYDNWCLSVLDRMLWDVFYFKNEKPTEEKYLKAMGIYAEDSDYISKIK